MSIHSEQKYLNIFITDKSTNHIAHTIKIHTFKSMIKNQLDSINDITFM